MPQRLGQHFLSDKSFLKKIVDALNIEKGDFIIEIGAGHGELTEVLAFRLQVLGKIWKLITIEKDIKLVKFLKEKFLHDKNIEVVYGDALKILPSITKTQNLTPKTYKLIGNIPYYITGYLFRIIADLEPKPKIIVFTIQKEVAERIIACPPSAKASGSGRQAKEGMNPTHSASMCGMNLLAASVQFWAKPEIIGYIPKTAFSPQPKVDSAIIRLTPNDKQCLPAGKARTMENKEKYYHLVKILFKQPRKTILNNISAGFKKTKPETEKILQKTDINPSHRPQNLTINQIIVLSTLF